MKTASLKLQHCAFNNTVRRALSMHISNKKCKVLVLGAGGLGCEILKNLVMLHDIVDDIHIIDFDTIELTNLNRQFLFTNKDIGDFKSVVAVQYINRRSTKVNLVAHTNDLTELSTDFIKTFDFVLSGLDAIEPRRFINQKLIDITKTTNFERCIPFIDGGIEGFKGHIKTVLPGITACWECSIQTLPTSQESVPICTVANNPRTMDHIIQHVVTVEFTNPNMEDINDLNRLLALCKRRAEKFNIVYDKSTFSISYITGVIKKIIPSISSTNSIISAQVCNELLKIYNDLADFENFNNFGNYNGAIGTYSFNYCHQREPNCIVCSII